MPSSAEEDPEKKSSPQLVKLEKAFRLMEPWCQYGVLDADENASTDGKAATREGDSSCGEVLKNLQKHDIVRSKTKNQIGMVNEVLGDSDSRRCVTDDKDEDEEDLEDEEDDEVGSHEESGVEIDGNGSKHRQPTAHRVRVLWRDGSESTESSYDVEVIERGFFHGDFVAAACDPTGQIGIVVDRDVNVDLSAEDKSIFLKDISSRNLRRIRDFNVGDRVVLGPWLGTIEDSSENVTIQFDDGSVREMMKADPKHLRPIGQNWIEDDFQYYPGQRVRASSLSVLKHSRWLSGSSKANVLEGTVTKVTVGSVFIRWITSAGYGPDSATTPPQEQSPKNLKLLSCFAHANWHLGDWCLLSSSTYDSAKDEHESTETSDESDAEVATTETRRVERALLIINTSTKVDVAWQDGTIERGLDSTSLIPIDSPGDHEFVAEQYVVERAADNDDDVETRRVGVVKSVDAKEMTARVRWLKSVARTEDPREFDKEEATSVYELEQHPDYDYCYGDVVVRLSPISSSVSDLAWFGNITGLKDGDIEVTWADGMISIVGPQAIHVWDDDKSNTDGSDTSDDAATWEAVEDDMESVNDPEDQGKTSGDSDGRSTSSSQENDVAEASELLDIVETLCNLKLPESSAPPLEEINSTFRSFDIIRDPWDHHFLGAQGQKNALRKWLKKVQKDWDILQNNLPEGIYVRVYEDRMDLLRATIVGAYGTPYQDGLFFFDFHLPPEYPDVPPSAHYHSGGWRINPNLYEEGKVCLSLLNTWTGKGNEVWNPLTSSILQVLVSLQGLVLNSRPYFNEAGYDKQVGTAEGEKNSVSYNENAFILNCKTMMHLMRRPPKDFEELVVEHFRNRGRYILKACNAYMEGELIGSLTKDASANGSSTRANSAGFKLMLSKVAPRLFSALIEVGADCDEFEQLKELPVD